MTKPAEEIASGAQDMSPPMTVAKVRKSFNRTVRNELTVTWFGRPLANLITPFFYNREWTANQVSALRIVIAAVGVCLLAIPGYAWGIIGAVIFYTVFVLDCVDGNIARLRNQVSFYGKFIDGLADFIFVLAAPTAAGIALWLQDAQSPFLIIGALCTIVSTTSQMVRSRLSFTREWMVNQSGPIEEAKNDRAQKVRNVQRVVASIYVNGTFFAPLLLVIPDGGRVWYLTSLVFVQLIPELIWLAAIIFEARIILNRGRRSIHSAQN